MANEFRVRGGAPRPPPVNVTSPQGPASSTQAQGTTQVQATAQVQEVVSAAPNQTSAFSSTTPPSLQAATGPHVPISPRPGSSVYAQRSSVGAAANVSEVSASRPSLTLADLRPGDVLLKVGVQNSVQGVIKKGQSIQGLSASQGSSETVHAAIYQKEGHLLEATGMGLAKAPVETGCTYHIYRFNNATVAQNAANMAEHHTAMRTDGVVEGYGEYATAGAAFSVFNSKGKPNPDKYWSGDAKSYSEQDKKDFFCSQLVIRSYGEAGAMKVPGQDPIVPIAGRTHSSPRMLEHLLKSDPTQWTCVGSLSLPRE